MIRDEDVELPSITSGANKIKTPFEPDGLFWPKRLGHVFKNFSQQSHILILAGNFPLKWQDGHAIL